MIKRLFSILSNKNDFWREIIRYGLLQRNTNPRKWQRFRHIVTRICALHRQIPEGLPTRRLTEMFPEIRNITGMLQFCPSTPYNVSCEELITLSLITAACKPQKVFEFGTFDGRTTLHLALNSPINASIYTIDIQQGFFEFQADTEYFDATKIGQCFLETSVCNKITMLTGDSRTFDFSPYENSIDLIFIDGDHSYEGVLADCRKAFDMVRSGTIIWHDYLMIKDVTKALVEIKKDKELYHIKGTTLAVWRS